MDMTIALDKYLVELRKELGPDHPKYQMISDVCEFVEYARLLIKTQPKEEVKQILIEDGTELINKIVDNV